MIHEVIYLQGTILRAVGGFYDVLDKEGAVFRCRARGRIKQTGTGLFVGDLVEFFPLDGMQGVLEKVELRRSLLKRPPIANAEQVVIVCSPQDPPLAVQLIDRLLVVAERECLQPIICLNKDDLPGSKVGQALLKEVYGAAGYPLIFTSAIDGRGLLQLKQLLCGRISVFAGSSGAGKSSLLNRLLPGATLRTGELSGKLRRGRHTTRNVELLPLSCGGLVADTPGFSQLDLEEIDRDSLPGCFPEFALFSALCRFSGCLHRDEPDCAVKDAIQDGKIPSIRYEHYLAFLKEVTTRGRPR